MLKMIIIDDERLIRNGLTDYLDWASLGIEIKAVCANGQEGLEAIHQHNPDIVLTDIAMPIMDGAELLKKVRMEGFGGQFIFISSYSEFSYAQEAVKYRAFDYLLKPLEAPALQDCVERCIAAIRAKPIPAEPPWDAALACDLLCSALLGMSRAESSLDDLMNRPDSAYKGQPVLAVGVWRDASQVPKRPGGQALFCALQPQCMAVVLPGEEAFPALEDAEPQAVWKCRRWGANLHLLLCETLLALSLEEQETTDQGADLPSPAAWQNRLADCARKAGEDALPLGKCWSLCRKALEALRRDVERIAPMPAKELESLNGALPARYDFTQVYDLFEQTLNAGLRLLEPLNVAASPTPYTRKVWSIIEGRYGQSLSLESIARSLGISQSHLSATFKADMGCTFSDYLFAYRMKVAKELLETGQYKIYEIAEKVGYPDMAQFSKRFKQYYKLSPRDMQKMLYQAADPDDPPAGKRNRTV